MLTYFLIFLFGVWFSGWLLWSAIFIASGVDSKTFCIISAMIWPFIVVWALCAIHKGTPFERN